MELAVGEEGLESLRREESRVERLLQEGKMSVVKLDELRYGLFVEKIRLKNLRIQGAIQ